MSNVKKRKNRTENRTNRREEKREEKSERKWIDRTTNVRKNARERRDLKKNDSLKNLLNEQNLIYVST